MRRLFLLLLVCTVLLTACGTTAQTEEQIEFWLVTEQTEGGGMNDQAEMLIDRFQETYPNVNIRLDILPSSEESRAGYLQKIRSEIMSGGGPDIYLLPTAPQTAPSEETLSTAYLEPLFSIVPLQMYNGIFTDISEYYDADEALGKENLVAAVMDAGVMDGARYILPLRYDYDVLAVDMNAFDDPSVFEGGITCLYGLALKMDDYRAAHAVNIRPSIGLVSELVDYEAGNVIIDAQELAEMLESYKDVFILADEENHQDTLIHTSIGLISAGDAYPGYNCSIDSYIYTSKKSDRIFTTAGYSFMQLELSDVIDAAAAIKVQEQNIAMCPVRAADGSLVAEVTYYGAVGSGCDYPELAYEFLRMFLTEEIQWEQYWPRNAGLGLEGMVEEGFPVRTAGFTSLFWENTRASLQASQDAEIKAKVYRYVPRRGKFLKEDFTVTDEDVPILSVKIDEARFPVITAEGNFFDPYISQLIDGADPQEIANNLIDDLQWYISEG